MNQQLAHRASESCDCQGCKDVKALARELSKTQATLAAIRTLLEPVAKAWVGAPIKESVWIVRRALASQVLALLDAAPKASDDGPAVGGPVTGTT